jgi:glycosyltransferase involved in cell wall biosynthesis
MSRRLIVVGPVPPPVHGVTVSTSIVLASPLLRETFAVEHLDTSDRRSGTTLGKWDFTNIRLALAHAVAMLRACRGDRGLVYLPLSQGTGGFLRDSLLILIAAQRGWDVVGHLRGSEFGRFYRRSPRPFRSWIRLTLNRLAAVAVMGDSLRWVLGALVPRERIAVVPNGTPDPGIDVEPHDGETVLFLSNLRRRKGVREAMEAALLVLERHPSARFVFAGEWEDAELEEQAGAAARRAGGHITFVSAATDAEKNALLEQAAILLFPPVEPEGHPRVVLEGLAAGLPVVTTDRGAIAETVVDGESGYVLSDPRPRELADRMLVLLENHDLRARMSRAARARYEERFSQAAADRVLVEWLESLVTGNGADCG